MWWSSCCTQTSIITKAPWKCTEKQSDLHCFFFLDTFNWEIENLWAKGRCSHPGFSVDWICRFPRISPLEMGTASQLCGETPSPTRMKWKLVTAEALNTLLYLTALIAFSPWKMRTSLHSSTEHWESLYQCCSHSKSPEHQTHTWISKPTVLRWTNF